MSEIFKEPQRIPGKRKRHELQVEFDVLDAAIKTHLPNCGPGLRELHGHPPIRSDTEEFYFLRDHNISALVVFRLFQAAFYSHYVQLGEIKLRKLGTAATKLSIDKTLVFEHPSHVSAGTIAQIADQLTKEPDQPFTSPFEGLAQEDVKAIEEIQSKYRAQLEEEELEPPSFEELLELGRKRQGDWPHLRELQSSIVADLIDRLRDEGHIESDDPHTSPEDDKESGGRPRNPDDDWAYKEIRNGRDQVEVYKEWLDRIPEKRRKRLADPQDSFKKAMRYRRKQEKRE